MKGFLKMLFGQGEKEYQEQHRKFNDAIPYDFPSSWTEEERMSCHPAYSGPLANTLDAANYRRANACHGPKSKREHMKQEHIQALRAEYEQEVAKQRGGRIISFEQWLQDSDAV